MKTKMKRIGAMVLACVMLWGVSVGVNAETRQEPPKHECAFSYMGTEFLGSTHISYHTYKDENFIDRQCEVLVDQYRDIYKCACGAVEYRNRHGVPRHTAHCGQ